MIIRRNKSYLHHIHDVFDRGTVAGMDERLLLERFVARRDEVAFEALVARFGPMVLGVCRRSLDDSHDVEDAFQATFLILVKKAATIRDGDLVGNWLYGVAYRVATRSRAHAQRRSRELIGVEEMAETPTRTSLSERFELHAVLDEELSRLPEKYRAPLVLCNLQGQTYEEAARRLKCPIGTIRSRTAKARELLRSRLVRRGFALSAAMLSTTLMPKATQAAVSLALLDLTVTTAAHFAAGNAVPAGAVSASVLTLTREVLRAMLISKLHWAAVTIVAVGALATGTGVVVGGQGNQTVAAQAKEQGSPSRDAKKGEPSKNDNPEIPPDQLLAGLARSRIEAAKQVRDAAYRLFMGGEIPFDKFYVAELRYNDAQLAITRDQNDRLLIFRRNLELVTVLENRVKDLFKKEQVTSADVKLAEFYRLDAAIRLAEEESGLKADIRTPVSPSLRQDGRQSNENRASQNEGVSSESLRKVRPRFVCLVEKIHVKVGQTVKAGDPLAEVFSTELAGAKNIFLTRSVQFDHDRRLHDLREKLIATGAISQQLWVDTQNDMEKSRLDFNLAINQLSLFGLSQQEIESIKKEEGEARARFTIRSPVNGTVNRIEAGPQDLCDAKGVLLVIDTGK